LIGDADLLLLYRDAIKMIEGERLVRNQRRLLKNYYLSLRSQAQAPLEFEAIKILRSRHTRISIAQRVLMQLSSPKDYNKGGSHQISRKQILERHFQRFILSSKDDEKDIIMRPATPPGEVARENLPSENDDRYLSEETESSGDDKSDDDKPEKLSYPIEDAKRFLIGGSPFEQYKQSFRRFIYPSLTATPSQEPNKETHTTTSGYSNDETLTQPKRLAVIEETQEIVARAILIVLWIMVLLDATFVRLRYNIENSKEFAKLCIKDICKNWSGISPLAPTVVRIIWTCVSSRDQCQRLALKYIEMWIYVLR
jgi:hypothetical protein